LRFQIEWSAPVGTLRAIEPRIDEVAAHAATLAAGYNDPLNGPLMGHEALITEAEVVEHYEGLLAVGAHPFLLFVGDALAGDADLRRIRDGAAEFAFLVAAPSAQGKGLGTRFAVMVHAFAFQRLGLERIYASVVPANVASRRVFEKLGHAVDTSEAARTFADEEEDLVTAIDRGTFERLHGLALAELRFSER
jgi:RimJ/RimL family protein N-acetyltransferase